jgi:hypothetical protein
MLRLVWATSPLVQPAFSPPLHVRCESSFSYSIINVRLAIGGSAATVVTSAGGQAVTLATSGAGAVTSFAGSEYTVATAAAASLTSKNAAIGAPHAFSFSFAAFTGLVSVIAGVSIGALMTVLNY